MKKDFNIPNLPTLTYKERTMIAPAVKRYFKERLDIWVKSYDIISDLKEEGIEFSNERLRKVINYLRCLGVPIASGNLGYCFTFDKEKRVDTIMSLKSRIEATLAAIKGLELSLRVEELDEMPDKDMDFFDFI